MIEFSGETSEEVKHYLLKKLSVSSFIIALSISIPFIMGAIIAAVMWHWVIAVTIIWFVFFIALATASPYINRSKTLNTAIPKTVSISEEFIESKNEKFHHGRYMTDVKKILDMENWYHIYFYFPHKNVCFICQKNLITKGTIKDFEKIFEGKIIRNRTNMNK